MTSFPGYTQEEKIEIAHRHLIPKQLEQHGLTPQQIQIPQVTTLDIITRLVSHPGASVTFRSEKEIPISLATHSIRFPLQQIPSKHFRNCRFTQGSVLGRNSQGKLLKYLHS